MRLYRVRFWAEGFICSLAAAASVLTFAWPDWIEGLTGWSPDRANGSLEIVIAFAFALFAVATGCVAYADRRRALAAGSHV